MFKEYEFFLVVQNVSANELAVVKQVKVYMHNKLIWYLGKAGKRERKGIDYFIKNIRTGTAKDYFSKKRKPDTRDKQGYQDVDGNNPDIKSEDFEIVRIHSVSFFDVLDNKQIKHLVENIDSLSKRGYEVILYVPKPDRFRAYNLIRMNYGGHEKGRLADIRLKDNEYISKISVSWTQIDNLYGLFEYRIYFKMPLYNEGYINFMTDTLKQCSNLDYIPEYLGIDEIDMDELDMVLLKTMAQDYFYVCAQHYITSLVYKRSCVSKARSGMLINITYNTIQGSVDLNKHDLHRMNKFYYNESKELLIEQSFDRHRYNYNLYICRGDLENFSFLDLVFSYCNDAYYLFLGIDELRYYEEKFSELLSSRFKALFGSSFLNLIKKRKFLTDGANIENKEYAESFFGGWCCYKRDKKVSIAEANKDWQMMTQKMQSDFSYLQTLSETRHTRFNFYASVIAIIIAVVSIIVALKQTKNI